MKNVLILVFGAILFAASANASALNNETVQSTMSKMSKVNNYMKSMLAESASLVTNNEKLVKKNKLWQGQLDTRLKPLIKIHLVKSKKHVDNEARITREINRYNSACSKPFKSKTPAYHKCWRDKETLDRVSRKHMAEKSVLQKERATLTKEEASYLKLIDTNNKQINKNFKRYLKIEDDIKKYKKTLGYYRTRLITFCAKADIDRDGEAIHDCYTMRWDSSKKNLPALGEILKGTQFFTK